MIDIKKNRNQLIDSTLGISIILVILYHFNYNVFFDKNGLYGVLVFFIISGYCMVFSISTSNNAIIFLKKRIFRLLPALIICGFITTLVENIFPWAHPDMLNGVSDYIKTILFLPLLNIPSKIIGFVVPGFNSYKLIDGSYWSLVVEFKFYYLLTLMYYFLSKKKYSFFLLLFIFIFSLALKVNLIYKIQSSSLILDFVEYLPYFVIGIGINQAHFFNRNIGLAIVIISFILLLLLRIMGVEAFSLPLKTNALIATILTTIWIYIIKYLTISNVGVNFFFSALAFIGRISYPLYLLHQEMGLVLIKVLSSHIGQAGSKIFVIGILIFLAYLINKYFENILQYKYS